MGGFLLILLPSSYSLNIQRILCICSGHQLRQGRVPVNIDHEGESDDKSE